MTRPLCLLGFMLAGASLLPAADSDVVFRSDVSLVRVDAQVLDRDHRAVTGLRAEDFVLLEEGKPQQIRNFGSENMPVDVLLLLDVSRSMQPHVRTMTSAAHQALRVLGNNDRVAIMVFDRATRLRMPFRNNREDVERELQSLLSQESFNGGTDITRGLLDAAEYIGKQGRRDARRAIVILTDDQTERNRDEEAVERALVRADAVLSALIAPDAMRNRRYGSPGGGSPMPRNGGGWPGGQTGGGMGGPLGGIILGRRGGSGYPGGGQGPVTMGSHTKSAGTSEIARSSGGDSMGVDDASAFETTLERIRQRYALHFYLPQGVKPGQERNIDVQLADAARRRYPNADVRFRRVYLAPGSPGDPAPAPSPSAEPTVVTEDRPPVLHRRPAVDQPVSEGPRVNTAGSDSGGWRRADDAAPSEAKPATPAPADQGGWRHADDPAPTGDAPSQGGWRRVKPGEQP